MESDSKAILICGDVTEEIIEEAIIKNADMIVSHHPLIFSGIKSLTQKNAVERIVVKAIKNDIALYAGHTNFDSVHNGVNKIICDKLQLQKTKILDPAYGRLQKLVTYIPNEYFEKVSKAIFAAGAGNIGQYDNCGYSVQGQGSFRANKNSNPFVGKKGQIHNENEMRFETVMPDYLSSQIISALKNSHPYEEVAYDIYNLENKYSNVGMGMIGYYDKPMKITDFLDLLKEQFGVPVVRHTKIIKNSISKVAVCGGSGSSLLKNAIKLKADVFVTADIKYHQFFDAENKIIIADIGHYESEQFTKELFYDILTKNFPKFAVYLTEKNTNPINYY